MMVKSLRHGIVWLVVMISGMAVLYECAELYRINQENDRIQELLSGNDIPIETLSSSEPETRLARAVYFSKKHQYQDALATLSVILSQGDIGLQAKIRYNLGNVYLAQAIGQVDAAHIDEARTLVNFAKQAYRQALALDSRFWDAKYNLEVAMRLLPELDRINIEDESTQQPKNPLWTTVPGFPRGLP
jgi:mxaK protein